MGGCPANRSGAGDGWTRQRGKWRPQRGERLALVGQAQFEFGLAGLELLQLEFLGGDAGLGAAQGAHGFGHGGVGGAQLAGGFAALGVDAALLGGDLLDLCAQAFQALLRLGLLARALGGALGDDGRRRRQQQRGGEQCGGADQASVTSERPVISGGGVMPSSDSTVGARSRNAPPSRRVAGRPT